MLYSDVKLFLWFRQQSSVLLFFFKIFLKQGLIQNKQVKENEDSQLELMYLSVPSPISYLLVKISLWLIHTAKFTCTDRTETVHTLMTTLKCLHVSSKVKIQVWLLCFLVRRVLIYNNPCTYPSVIPMFGFSFQKWIVLILQGFYPD